MNLEKQTRKHPFIVTIASGKGGTGKTTIATNLAKILRDQSVTFLDCDVEEPNGHLFLKPIMENNKGCTTFIPVIDLTKCTFCGACSEICRFNAIVTVKKNVLVFPELCHGCQGCLRICPFSAISDGHREIGTIEEGHAGNIRFIHAHLQIGEFLAPRLIHEVKQTGMANHSAQIIIIDAPPGTSCPVIESVRGSDGVLLVTEPTPFGLYDLRLAVEMVRHLQIPLGVVINRATAGDHSVHTYCHEENIPILMEFPDDREIAVAYSQGFIIVDVLPQYRKKFLILYEKLLNHFLIPAEVPL